MRNDMFVEGTFTWFTGVIEDVIDPKKRNRVKVRCFGYHTDNKGILPVVDLPWATVLMPNTSPSVDGIGMNHQLLEGSWVIGFFRDGPSAQDPIIMGSMASFTETAPDTTKGFTGRFGITANTEDLPAEVDSFNDNQVIKTVGGHLIELDNALNQERINIKHKSGTTILIDKDGGIQIDAVNDIVNIDGNVTVTGYIHATGDISTAAGNEITLASHTHTEVPGTGGQASPNPTTQETTAGNGGAGPVVPEEESEST
jgi:phage baseplate assembly protein gpV|tara:strand:+ start:4263 stop:5030 length:768 start_codon:yes stop_codon:yes gene_type:complete